RPSWGGTHERHLTPAPAQHQHSPQERLDTHQMAAAGSTPTTVAPTASQSVSIARITPEQSAALAESGSATVSSQLSKLGSRDAHLTGLAQMTDGPAIAGTALTLKFMPKREDLYRVDEYADPEVQLHRHVLYAV